MSIDLTLLQVIKNREEYEKYRPLIKDHLVDEHTLKLVRDFKAYFDKYDKHTEIDFDVFPTWFKQVRHPNIKKDDSDFYTKLFDKIKLPPKNDSAAKLKEDLKDLHVATMIVNKAQDMLDGKITGDNFLADIQASVDDALAEKRNNKDVPWDTSSVVETVEALDYDSGIKFPLSCLDESCGSMHPSKFIVVGAYVDTGKSTFLSHLAANTAIQANTMEDKWYSGRPIIWFNNEGSSREIKMYCLQSTLNARREHILQYPERAEKAYLEAVGDIDAIRVIPCQGWHIKEAEQIIKMYKPCMVLYDMLDNFSGFETDGTIDQRYRALYDYGRQMADKYEHTAIATSQCIGEANGQERIEMHMLAGSRVAKQSTADLMIMLGRSLEYGKQNTRYIYTPKNKFTQKFVMDEDGRTKRFNRQTCCEVIFDGEKKRYLDPQEE